VIPVAPQPEPVDFARAVRAPGMKWIRKSGLNPQNPVPTGTAIPPHWTKCLPALRSAYGSICAYAGVFVPLVVGAPSVEHFLAKSKRLDQAYEWANYRFVCAKMNSRKRNFDDVLDPFTLETEMFVLNAVNGAIMANPSLSASKQRRVGKTIRRLDLDDVECREMRLSYVNDYINHDISQRQLERHAPFVYLEMKRQNLL
jgi:uncharacterized protein (TIGR02646 family)